MNCDEAMALLSAELDGMLSETEQAALDAHLRTCEACRTLRAELQTAESALLSAQEEAPEALHTRVMDAVHQEKAAKRKERRRWLYVGAAAAAALALAIFSAAGLMQTPLPKNARPAVSMVGALQKQPAKQTLRGSETAQALAEQNGCPVLVVWTNETITDLPGTPDGYTEDGAAIYTADFETLRTLDARTGRHMELCDPDGQYRPDADPAAPALVLVYPE